jgi:hypothetical protein
MRSATLLTTVAALGLAAPAFATPAVGLVGDRTLVMIDAATGMAAGSMDVTGVERLLGIDVRPATGALVGVTADGAIVTIDAKSGVATEVARMTELPPMDAGPVVVDFNPAADRLRLMTGTRNHRVNPDTGEVTIDGDLAFEAGDMHAGEAPMIVAAAYTNSHGKPEKTAMYDIDATIVALIRQTAPNDGTLAAVGKLGLDGPGEVYAFDISTTPDLANTAWLANGGMLYRIDLETGAATGATEIAGLDGELRDIAVLPAM